MQLKKIEHYFQQYEKFLKTREAEKNLYLWESQRIFQENWDLDTDQLAAMYDASLQNSQTRRLWKREAYEPKKMMLHFLEMQPDFVRSMFKDLFNEEKEIEGRVGRFVFYCDELLLEYKANHPVSVENNHYHDDDYGMVSFYLAFRYPDRYTRYEPAAFRELLRKLGSGDIPKANDFERFSKVMRTLYKMMQKQETLLALHQKRLDPRKHYSGESLLLIYDFYAFVNQTTSQPT